MTPKNQPSKGKELWATHQTEVDRPVKGEKRRSGVLLRKHGKRKSECRRSGSFFVGGLGGGTEWGGEPHALDAKRGEQGNCSVKV